MTEEQHEIARLTAALKEIIGIAFDEPPRKVVEIAWKALRISEQIAAQEGADR